MELEPMVPVCICLLSVLITSPEALSLALRVFEFVPVN